MKVGILTYHSSHNYGAFLQAYALCNCIREQTGYEVEIINYNMKKCENVNKANIFFNKRHPATIIYNLKRYFMFEQARSRYHTLSQEVKITDELEEFSQWISSKYDIIIVGSDEVWKLDGYRGFPNPYWLPNVAGCMKMSYAASSRTNIENVSDETLKEISDLLASFSYIGVRDEVTRELIEKAISGRQKVYLNCDPTFAYEFNISKDSCRCFVEKKLHISGKRKIIALMIGVPELAYAIIDRYKNQYDFISLYDYYGGTASYKMLDPFEWMKVIAGADGLITTFFHGMVFSIKNNTPFVIIENREINDNRYSKSYDLLKRNGIESQYILLENIDKVVEEELPVFLSSISSSSACCDYTKVCKAEKKMFIPFLEQLKVIERQRDLD